MGKPRLLNVRSGSPPGAIYIGRPSKWGNPYRVVQYGRPESIALYEEYLVASGLVDDIEELRGKDLVCWCAPLPCHGAILLELANMQKEKEKELTC